MKKQKIIFSVILGIVLLGMYAIFSGSESSEVQSEYQFETYTP